MPHLAEANSNAQARFFGGALSGLAEIVIFHPLDTVGKRLMAIGLAHRTNDTQNGCARNMT